MCYQRRKISVLEVYILFVLEKIGFVVLKITKFSLPIQKGYTGQKSSAVLNFFMSPLLETCVTNEAKKYTRQSRLHQRRYGLIEKGQ